MLPSPAGLPTHSTVSSLISCNARFIPIPKCLIPSRFPSVGFSQAGRIKRPNKMQPDPLRDARSKPPGERWERRRVRDQDIERNGDSATLNTVTAPRGHRDTAALLEAVANAAAQI